MSCKTNILFSVLWEHESNLFFSGGNNYVSSWRTLFFILIAGIVYVNIKSTTILLSESVVLVMGGGESE